MLLLGQDLQDEAVVADGSAACRQRVPTQRYQPAALLPRGFRNLTPREANLAQRRLGGVTHLAALVDGVKDCPADLRLDGYALEITGKHAHSGCFLAAVLAVR